MITLAHPAVSAIETNIIESEIICVCCRKRKNSLNTHIPRCSSVEDTCAAE